MIDQAELDALLGEAESLVREAEAELSPAKPVKQAVGAPRSGAPSVPHDARRALSIKVPLIVRLAERKMPVSQVVAMTPGAIIEFEKNAEDAMDLLSNNEQIGFGTPVKVGEKFGIRVTSIRNTKGKIEALGPGPSSS